MTADTTTKTVALRETELQAYGRRDEIKEMELRITTMLPGAKVLGHAGALALAQASIAMQLNPFTGEIWAIPQGGQNREGTYDNYAVMVGIKGLRAKAHEQARADHGLYTVHFRLPRDEEIEGLQISKGDIVRVCDLTVSGNRARRHRDLTGEVPRYTGIGIYKNGERTKMNPLQVARKRAEADAIKQAFDVPLPMVAGASISFADGDPDDYDPGYYQDEPRTCEGSAQDAIAELYGDPPPPNTAPGNGQDEIVDATYQNGDTDDEFLAGEELTAEPKPQIDPPEGLTPDNLMQLAVQHLSYGNVGNVMTAMLNIYGRTWRETAGTDWTAADAWAALQEHKAAA